MTVYDSLTTIANGRAPGNLIITDDAAIELASEIEEQGFAASRVEIYQGILDGHAKFMGHILVVAND